MLSALTSWDSICKWLYSQCPLCWFLLLANTNAIWPWGYISIFWHFCFSVCFCLKMHCEKETNVALTHIQVLWNPNNCRVRYLDLSDTLDKPWQTEHQPCCRLWNGSVSDRFHNDPSTIADFTMTGLDCLNLFGFLLWFRPSCQQRSGRQNSPRQDGLP